MRWRFIDRVMQFEPWRAIEGAKAVSLEEYSLLEPFGRKGRLPEVLVIEAGVHLTRWLVMASSGFEQSCVLDSVDGLAFSGEVGAGSALTLSLAVTRREAAGVGLSLTVSDAGQPVATGALGVSLLPLCSLANPDDMRTLWQELYAKTSGA